ncbi:hypothetical protein JCM11641_007377 [Rhodosporidiobolus odoratus]
MISLRLLVWALAGLVLVTLMCVFRLVQVLHSTHTLPRPRRHRPPIDEAVLAVFLGSGGHTAEMLRLVAHLDFENKFKRRVWMVQNGDRMSGEKALAMEKRIGGGEFRILRIPRARRVHQSYLTSPFTTLHTLFFCLWHITLAPFFSNPPRGGKRQSADVILLNGPGSCVPIACSAFLPRILALPSPSLIYIESLARTRRLSLSGRLVRPLVDRFFVQWDSLRDALVEREGIRGRGWSLRAEVECQGWLV